MSEENTSNIKKRPVTLLTGFLGAGKTTLLNYILNTYTEKRFVILENEYGEVSIDSKIVRNNDKTKLFELNDGCICCSLKDELGTVLNTLVERNETFDHLIVEATGIANPSDIIKSFVVGDVIPTHFYIDSVICLVDALWFLKQFDQHNELRKQIAQSDTILINKKDLANPNTIQDIASLIKEVSPFANIHLAEYGIAKNVDLLNTGAYLAHNVEHSVINFKGVMPELFWKNTSQHRIKSHSIVVNGSMDMERFTAWMDRFMYVNTGNLFRVKGILYNKTLDYKIVLQSVYDHCSVEKGSNWANSDSKTNTLVFIGTELHERRIKEEIEALIEKE